MQNSPFLLLVCIHFFHESPCQKNNWTLTPVKTIPLSICCVQEISNWQSCFIQIYWFVPLSCNCFNLKHSSRFNSSSCTGSWGIGQYQWSRKQRMGFLYLSEPKHFCFAFINFTNILLRHNSFLTGKYYFWAIQVNCSSAILTNFVLHQEITHHNPIFLFFPFLLRRHVVFLIIILN